jgi:hypothetical protein
MRLYSRTGATAVDTPEGHFDAGEDGAFDLPETVARQMHSFHVNGEPLWETDIERQHRLIAEEMERRKDPATLLDAVQQLVQAAQAVSQVQAGQDSGGGAGPAESKSRRRSGKATTSSPAGA